MSKTTRTEPGVFIYRPVDPDGASHQRMLAAGCLVTVGDGRSILEQPAPEHDVHALLGATHVGPPIGDSVFRKWPSLRIVAKYTIGTDDVDVDRATELGILVTHCPVEANWGGVAEGTLAMMLALLKKLGPRDHAVRQGRWRSAALEGTYVGRREDGYPGITIGIVGLGRIGRRLAALLAPWRARLVGCDPYVDEDVFAACGVARLSLEQLLRQSDVITLHCNLTEETKNLLDRRRFTELKAGAVVVNTSRGDVVDIDALCDALDSGRVGAAALDVFPEEPLPQESRIRNYDDRVILSPHMVAANQGGTLAAAVPWATDAVIDALSGRVPPHVYNESAVPVWEQRFGGRSLLER